ncbi:heme exporter protein CcmD [Pasteurellaceae bacterium Pebbles2]|nr:heme exporter protein CcmD [Pasteurellaceae bacterium Pebbles2]
MFFQSWNEFLDMGGYGFYVWLSYGLSFLAIALLVVQSYREKHAIFQEVRRENERLARVQASQKRSEL